MKTVAIIPMRSGSKRFPNKNLSIIDGKSLLENTVNKLLSARIDYIFVSTDYNYILKQSENEEGVFSKQNVFCIRRPIELSQDETSTEDVLANVIIQIHPLVDEEDFIVILAQVTSPNWSPHRLTYAINKLLTKKVDSVISVSPDYKPNGCFYIFKCSTFITLKELYTPNIYLVVLTWEESADIDFKYQLHIAQAISKGNHDI